MKLSNASVAHTTTNSTNQYGRMHEYRAAIRAASDFVKASLKIEKNLVSTLNMSANAKSMQKIYENLGVLIADMAHQRGRGRAKQFTNYIDLERQAAEAIEPEPQYGDSSTQTDPLSRKPQSKVGPRADQRQCTFCNSIIDIVLDEGGNTGVQVNVMTKEQLENVCSVLGGHGLPSDKDIMRDKDSGLYNVVFCMPCYLKYLQYLYDGYIGKRMQDVRDAEGKMAQDNLDRIQQKARERIDSGEAARLLLESALYVPQSTCCCANGYRCRCGCNYPLHNHRCECNAVPGAEHHEDGVCCNKSVNRGYLRYQGRLRQEEQQRSVQSEVKYFHDEFPSLLAGTDGCVAQKDARRKTPCVHSQMMEMPAAAIPTYQGGYSSIEYINDATWVRNDTAGGRRPSESRMAQAWNRRIERIE